MKCHDFELRIRDLLGRDLTNLQDRSLVDHVRDCPECGQRFQEERQLQSELARFSECSRQLTPSDQIRQKLRQFHREETRSLRQLQRKPERPDRAPLWLLVAATLVLGVTAGWLYQSTTRSIPQEIASIEGRTVQRNRTPIPAPISKDSEATPERMYSEFIPIGNCRSMDCLDQAHMMRIDLPRSSVAYFGIPKARILSRGDRIAADVLVGDDGIARAIRFVY